MDIARNAFLRATLIASLLAMALVAAPAHAAVSVIVNCNAYGTGEHMLVELDYDARTVRVHAVDDYGNPDTEAPGDHTYPAQITDKEVTWTEYQTQDGGFQRERLSRLSGILTTQSDDPGGRIPAYMETKAACKRYTPPVVQQKF